MEVTELFRANLQNFQSPRQPVLIKLSPEILGKGEKNNFLKILLILSHFIEMFISL